MIRYPVANGRFYPDNPEKLKNMVLDFIKNADVSIKNAFSIIAPHAGYIFSGKTAGFSYAAIKESNPDTIIFLGPNHTGYGSPISLSSCVWETPLGRLNPDMEIIDFLCETGYVIDESAHKFEHSIEVQLPFVQTLFEKTPEIVCICMADYSFEACQKIAFSLSKVLKVFNDKKIVFVASSDFSHYVSPDVIRELDDVAIEHIINGNAEGFYATVSENNMSICGFLPITTLLVLNKILNGSVKFLNYSHSAMAYPMDEAVGYGAFAFYLK